MQNLIVLALCLLPTAVCRADVKCGRTHVKAQDKIVGGGPAGEGNWPWLVCVGADAVTNVCYCTGTLISDRHVLSASHCFDFGSANASRFWVSAGAVDFHNATYNESIVSYAVHPGSRKDYPDATHDDFSIIEIPPVEFSERIQPICLADSFKEVPMDMAWVAGYGYHDVHLPDGTIIMKQDSILRDNTIEFHPPENCRLSNKTWTFPPDEFVCAGGYERGAWHSDSGGPLMVDVDGVWYEVGVVHGPSDNVAEDHPEQQWKSPARYVRIARSDHCEWINNATKGAATCVPIQQ